MCFPLTGRPPSATVMASFAAKLDSPLANLRPQVGGALYFASIAVLMAMCPYLSFVYHAAWLLWLLYPQLRLTDLGLNLYALFLRVSIFFFMRAPGVKVHMYGDIKDVLERKENILYISNHQSSMDWIVACFLALRARCLTRVRFIMKQELHWVPMVGFFLKLIGHIYVRRKGFNQERLIQSLNHITNMLTPVWLGIFPEGTRHNPEDRKAIATSQEIARSNNLPVLLHQLTPRSKGSWLLVDRMRPYLSAVYSVTIVYEQSEPKGQRSKAPSAADVAKGACSDVHVHVKRIPMDQVPRDEATFAPWLHGQFVERDRLLSEYYETRSFASWGPAEEDPVKDGAFHPDLFLVAVMALGLLFLPFVRKAYLMWALCATLYGYVDLTLKPPF